MARDHVLVIDQGTTSTRAVVYDPKQDMVSLLHGMDLNCPVKIFNPLDRRAVAWDMARDCKTPAAAIQMASIMIADKNEGANQHWADTGRHMLSGVVIGLIYLTMWALRRFMLGPQAAAKAAKLVGRLEVLDTTHLAPNRTVYLVEVADRVLVLGATQTTLSTLAEIKEPGAIDLLKARPAEEPAGPPSFADQFQKLTASLSARPTATNG